MLANWIDLHIPEQTKDRLFSATAHDGKPFREHLFSTSVAQSREYFLRYFFIWGADFLFVWISICAMYLVGKSAGYSPPIAALAAIILALLLPFFMTAGGYFYDYPELAFLALAVWMALKFDWWWLIPVVALATWNKESFLLFIPTLYPLLRQRSSRIKALAGTGTLGLTCAAVYYSLRLRFRHNPGGTVIWNDQITSLFHPSNLLTHDTTYGIPILSSYNPLTLVLIGWTVWRGWRCLPRPIQRHAQLAAVINLPLYLLFCVSGELRDLSLLYIALLLLLGANLTAWANVQTKNPTLTSE